MSVNFIVTPDKHRKAMRDPGSRAAGTGICYPGSRISLRSSGMTQYEDAIA